MLYQTLISQTPSPSSLKSPTETDLVARHSQHLQKKHTHICVIHSQNPHYVLTHWEHTCNLYEQIQTGRVIMPPRVGKYGFCPHRCNCQHCRLLLGHLNGRNSLILTQQVISYYIQASDILTVLVKCIQLINNCSLAILLQRIHNEKECLLKVCKKCKTRTVEKFCISSLFDKKKTQELASFSDTADFEIFVLLRCYAAVIGSQLVMFQDNLSVPSSWTA